MGLDGWCRGPGEGGLMMRCEVCEKPGRWSVVIARRVHVVCSQACELKLRRMLDDVATRQLPPRSAKQGELGL